MREFSDYAPNQEVKLNKIIKGEYVITDYYGQLCSKIEANDFNLESKDENAFHVEGTMETSYGTFIIEGTLAEARSTLKKIEQLVELSDLLPGLTEARKEAEYKSAAATNAMRRGGSTSAALDAVNVLDKARDEEKYVSKNLERYNKELEDLKL